MSRMCRTGVMPRLKQSRRRSVSWAAGDETAMRARARLGERSSWARRVEGGWRPRRCAGPSRFRSGRVVDAESCAGRGKAAVIELDSEKRGNEAARVASGRVCTGMVRGIVVVMFWSVSRETEKRSNDGREMAVTRHCGGRIRYSRRSSQAARGRYDRKVGTYQVPKDLR